MRQDHKRFAAVIALAPHNGSGQIHPEGRRARRAFRSHGPSFRPPPPASDCGNRIAKWPAFGRATVEGPSEIRGARPRSQSWPLACRTGVGKLRILSPGWKLPRRSRRSGGRTGSGPMLTWLLPALFAMIAGISFVVQQAVNTNLRLALHSAAWAGFVSYLGGTLCMLALALATNEPFPNSTIIARSHWWAWTGGLFGTIYIGVSILLLPRLGAASFVGFLIAGQMLSSIVFDRFGIFGLVQRAADPSRLFGAILLIAGAALVLR